MASSSYAAEPDDPFNFFNQNFEEVVDVRLSSFNYERPLNGVGKAGDMEFSRFSIMNPSLSLDLGGTSNFLTTSIYINKNFLGVNGNNLKLAFNIDQEHFRYIDAFKWFRMNNIKLDMDKEKILMKGDFVSLREPQTQIQVHDFNLTCERHPDYLANTPDGFLAGCNNFGTLVPTEGNEAIDFEFRYFGETEESKIKIKTKLKKFDSDQRRVYLKNLQTSVLFDKETTLSAKNLNVDCEKQEDLINFAGNNVVAPCLNHFKLMSDDFNVSFRSEPDTVHSFGKSIGFINEEDIHVSTNGYIYKNVDTIFEIRKTDMTCQKVGDFSTIEADNYLRSCYNHNEFRPSVGNETSSLFFKVDDPKMKGPTKDKGDVLTIKTNYRNIKVTDDKLKLDGKVGSLNLDDEFIAKIYDYSLTCSKQANILELDMDKILKDCKKNMFLNPEEVLIDDKPEDISMYLNVREAQTTGDRLNLNLQSLQMVDPEENLTLFDVKIDCLMEEESDLFEKRDVLRDCTKESNISIKKIISIENEDIESDLIEIHNNLETSHINPSQFVSSEKHSVKDVQITIKDNNAYLKAKVRFLGMDLKVELGGKTSFNWDKNRILIDVKKTKLPLGIKSKTVLLYLMKHFAVNETVTIKKGKISIQL